MVGCSTARLSQVFGPHMPMMGTQDAHAGALVIGALTVMVEEARQHEDRAMTSSITAGEKQAARAGGQAFDPAMCASGGIAQPSMTISF